MFMSPISTVSISGVPARHRKQRWGGQRPGSINVISLTDGLGLLESSDPSACRSPCDTARPMRYELQHGSGCDRAGLFGATDQHYHY